MISYYSIFLIVYYNDDIWLYLSYNKYYDRRKRAECIRVVDKLDFLLPYDWLNWCWKYKLCWRCLIPIVNQSNFLYIKII